MWALVMGGDGGQEEAEEAQPCRWLRKVRGLAASGR